MTILRKIIIGILFFGVYIHGVGAFDAELKAHKQLDGNIQAHIVIHTDNGEQAQLKEIMGIENFDILSRSQSQSSSNSVVIINGKTQSQGSTALTLQMLLHPNTQGNITLGPVVVQSNSKEIQSNSVTINSQGITPQSPQGTKTQAAQTIQVLSDDNTTIKTPQKLEKSSQSFDRNTTFPLVYILPIVFLIFLILLYWYFKNNPKYLQKIFQKEQGNACKLEDSTQKTTQEKHNTMSSDFESPPEEYEYPQISDSDYCTKLHSILKSKLGKMYSISSIDSLTLGEVLKHIPEEEQEAIHTIITQLQRIQYSPIIGDKQKILDEIKNI